MSRRTFTMRDQRDFAELSGDHNPGHVDPIYARRLIFGRPVVHGIHALLWGLDRWLDERSQTLTLQRLKVNFLRSIGVEQAIDCLVMKENQDHVEIRLSTDTAINVKILAAFEQNDNVPDAHLPIAPLTKPTCQVLEQGDLESRTGRIGLYLDQELAGLLFPNLVRCISSLQISQMLATTRLIGMECPGLHSIFTGMDLTLSIASSTMTDMQYRVTNFDDRFSNVSLRVRASGLEGNLTAFLRPAPKMQMSFTDFRKGINPREFMGQNALVIGGSRGLGEVTAKILSAGGANVKLTYHSGADDAKRVVNEILSGGGMAGCFPFNALGPLTDLPVFIDGWCPTHLYYFATPFILNGKKGAFSYGLFENFCNFYVQGFLNSVTVAFALGDKLKKVFYPSSVFVDEVPADMGEYLVAKAAGESLCSFLEKTRGIEICRIRLPRLDTDQNASLLPIEKKDPYPLLLDILRSLADSSLPRH